MEIKFNKALSLQMQLHHNPAHPRLRGGGWVSDERRIGAYSSRCVFVVPFPLVFLKHQTNFLNQVCFSVNRP